MFKFIKRRKKRMDAFMAGRKARLYNEPNDINPFSTTQDEYEWWNGGWYAVNHRLQRGNK